MAKRTWVGLGTAISNAASRLGIPECPGCGHRRAVLDRIVPRIWPARTVPHGAAAQAAPSSSANGLSTASAETARRWHQKR